MSITLNGTTGISTPDITSTTAPSLVGTNFTSLPSASLTGALPVINGSNLTNLTSANLTGALPAISGSSLTSLTSASLTGALPAIDGSALTGISSGAGTTKAWANFDGNGTVSIRNSGNISSLTDNGTGDFTLNITTALTHSNYSSTLGSTIITNHPVTSASVRAGPTTTSLRTSWGTTGGNGITGAYNDNAATYANVVITL